MKRPVRLPWILLALSIVFSLVACSQQASSTASPTPKPSLPATPQAQPTLIPSPTETVLYQADWSHGFNGWRGPSSWSVVNGQLLVNSPGESSITVPYRPAVSDYAVEMRVQLVGVLKPAANEFFLNADPQPQKDGYGAGFVALTVSPPTANPGPNSYSGFAQVATDSIDPNAPVLPEIDFVPGSHWRTYRLEAQGNKASLFIDGIRSGYSTSLEQALSNGPLSLDARGLILRISSFRIMTL